MQSWRRYAGLTIAVLVALGACSSESDDVPSHKSTTTTVDDDGNIPIPTISEATGGAGRPIGGMRYDVTEFGYQEHEYFFEGTAKTYPPTDVPPAAYRSRMIVWTPADSTRFNGTTVVEWAHVSDYGQFELTVDLNAQAPMLEQQGFAFALVSAEEGGVCDQSVTGCTDTSLKGADPQRYGSLDHPGDPYSFAIFNQALQALKRPTGIAPLGELETRFIIVEGFQPSIDKWFTQGAPASAAAASPFGINGPLNAYLANGADTDARLADAFLIDAAAPASEPERYRVPTLHHLDESAIRREPSRDTANHVTWEIVGAPHADRWASDHIRLPSSTPPPHLTRPEEEARRDAFDDFGQTTTAGGEICAPGRATGSAFPRRFTLNAALVSLHEWLNTGQKAPSAQRIERTRATPDSPTRKLSRGQDGNAVGGLRSPVVDVPFATYNGEACVSAGTMVSLSSERLAQLFSSHEDYVNELLAATNNAVADRVLVCQDAETIMRKASEAAIGGADSYSAAPDCVDEPHPPSPDVGGLPSGDSSARRRLGISRGADATSSCFDAGEAGPDSRRGGEHHAARRLRGGDLAARRGRVRSQAALPLRNLG